MVSAGELSKPSEPFWYNFRKCTWDPKVFLLPTNPQSNLSSAPAHRTNNANLP